MPNLIASISWIDSLAGEFISRPQAPWSSGTAQPGSLASWESLPPSWIKVNVDGAASLDGRAAVASVVARDHKGVFLSAIAQPLADCEGVVELIHGNVDHHRWELLKIIADILTLKAQALSLTPFAFKLKDRLHMKVMESRGVPRQQACTSRLASEGSNLLPTIGICYLTFNTVVAIFRAYAHDDIPMMAFVLFLYGGFISLYSCMMALDRLPRNEESRRKDLLKIIIWILLTSLNFGIAIRFAMLLYPIASVIIFAMATVSSASAFYFFFIFRAENAGAGNFCGDKKIKSTRFFSPSPESFSDNKISALESSISPLEKV
ncbi:hypothetical protein HHK36_007189 [Tetracentron sinense]|uniref:Uncharacterized protein n=1 Tax=Tetracentron sinense TaxID=13715 RepID=A0A835DL08_TETSI|nr:hypothetical protein HHK36_007189 [Tetracentron sinense]